MFPIKCRMVLRVEGAMVGVVVLVGGADWSSGVLHRHQQQPCIFPKKMVCGRWKHLCFPGFTQVEFLCSPQGNQILFKKVGWH